MASLLRWARSSMRKTASPPMCFPASGFEIIGGTDVLEEERFDAFKTRRYYPVNIGDVFASKYQVIGKLGYGATSTVWLARDLQAYQHVTLKVYTRGEDNRDEFDVYRKMSQTNSSHPGFAHVRTAVDLFTIPRSGGGHDCLVQKPMWDSFRDLLFRNPTGRFTEDLLKAGLSQVFHALDFLHTECRLVHTDIKGDNILQEIEDISILENFTKAEMEHPSPRKFVEDAPVYASRRFERPKLFGRAVLSDFGSTVRGDQERNDDVQPNVYRSPEVMLKVSWTYPIDIWNVGVMIWDLFEGKHMFYGNDPDGKGYSTRAHLAEVVGMMGLPPLGLLQRGKRSHEFFTEDGQWKADVEVRDTSLDQSEEILKGKDKELFLSFMRGMLQWRPEDRKTAKQLLEDPWLNDQ